MKAFTIAAILVAAVAGNPSMGMAQAGGGFKPAGKMNAFRVGQTATVLPNGKILIVGGRDNVTPSAFPIDCFPYTNLASSELYDPSTGVSTASGSMSRARVWHTATLLGDGKVLIVGGDSINPSEFNDCVPLGLTPSAELYDPSTGRFTNIENVTELKSEHTATLLRDGKVLFVGPGQRAEIYDPFAQMFLFAGMMSTPRSGHTATLLGDGKILVTGGWTPDGCVFLDSAELYDPSTGGFTPVGSMSSSRYAHRAALLPNGTVLITGGEGDTQTLSSAEVYDPASRTFIPAGKMTRPRSAHSMTLLPGGKVLVAGGDATGRASAELYDPADGTFSATTPMNSFRASHNANVLSNGTVLVMGGSAGSYITATDKAEVYDPDWTPQAGPPQSPRRPARDFNGDGKSDVLWRDIAGTVSTWLLNGDKDGEDRVIANIWPGWTIVGIGDFNGDERSDVLWRDGSGHVVIWLMDGPVISGYEEVRSVPASWSTAGVADFNGDGRADILWHDPAGQAVIWLMDGFAIVSNATIGNIGDRWNIAGAKDFDGDGKADILWRHQDSGNVATSLMDGLTVSRTLLLGEGPTPLYSANHKDWLIAGVDDFDGDQSADILWRDIRGNVVMWLMNGTTAITKWHISQVWIGWTIAGTGDFNGDNMADILWRDSAGNVSIWSMDGIALSSWRLMGNVRDRTAQ